MEPEPVNLEPAVGTCGRAGAGARVRESEPEPEPEPESASRSLSREPEPESAVGARAGAGAGTRGRAGGRSRSPRRSRSRSRSLSRNPRREVPEEAPPAAEPEGDPLQRGTALVAASGYHTCAIDSRWGCRVLGCQQFDGYRLGDPSVHQAMSPVPIRGISDAVAISIGDSASGTGDGHTCVLHGDSNRLLLGIRSTEAPWGKGTPRERSATRRRIDPMAIRRCPWP